MAQRVKEPVLSLLWKFLAQELPCAASTANKPDRGRLSQSCDLDKKAAWPQRGWH